MPNVLGPRDLVSRPENMDETVLHTHGQNEVTVCGVSKGTERGRSSACQFAEFDFIIVFSTLMIHHSM